MSKKSRLREPFHKQHGQRAQALLRSESQDLVRSIDHCQVNWLVKRLSYWHAKSFDWLFNTFAANEKYPVLNKEN